MAAGIVRAQYVWDGSTYPTFSAAVGSNTLANGATLSISTGNDHGFNATALINNGTVTWLAGNLYSGSGGTFTNNAAFNDQQTAGYTITNPGWGGSFTFTNNGTYSREGSNTTSFQVPFNNNGTVTVTSGDLRFNAGGTMSGTSIVDAASGTTVQFTSNYTLQNGSQLKGAGTFVQTAGTLTLDGTLNASAFNWHGGDWSASSTGHITTIGAETTLNLGASADHGFNYRSIVNSGTVNWLSGHLYSGNGGSFINDATFKDQQTAGYTANNPGWGGSFAFTNNGNYVREGSNTTYFQVPFNNNGTVTVTSGDLRFNAGGTMSGTSIVDASAGTNVTFASNYTLQTGSQLTGAGNFVQIAGTLTLDGTLNASAFNWHGGDWSASSTGHTTTIGAETILNLGAGADHGFNYRSIVNSGTVNWLSGHLYSGNGGSFINDATFNDQQTSGYTVNNPGWGGSFAFTNNGTYVREGSNTTYFQVPFNNNGTVTVTSGDLRFNAGGTMSGTSIVDAASGTTVQFSNNYTLQTGSQLKGAGTFVQTAGTLTVDGTLTASAFNWHGGDWNASGTGHTTTIGAETILNLGASADHGFNYRSIVNSGTVNWLSGHLYSGNGGSFINDATFNDQQTAGYTVNNPGWGGSFAFTNNGTYNRSASGTTTFNIPFTNNGVLLAQSGAISFASTFTNNGGNIVLAGGSLSFSNPLNAGTGTISGSGSISASGTTVGGVVSPGTSPGKLSFIGNLTLLAGATSIMELGGTPRGVVNGYDAIDVSGALAFGGTLNVTLTGGFNPTSGQSFDLFDWGTTSGTFSTVNLPALTSGLSWDASLLYTSGVISVTGIAIPEPESMGIITLVGLAVFLRSFRLGRR